MTAPGLESDEEFARSGCISGIVDQVVEDKADVERLHERSVPVDARRTLVAPRLTSVTSCGSAVRGMDGSHWQPDAGRSTSWWLAASHPSAAWKACSPSVHRPTFYHVRRLRTDQFQHRPVPLDQLDDRRRAAGRSLPPCRDACRPGGCDAAGSGTRRSEARHNPRPVPVLVGTVEETTKRPKVQVYSGIYVAKRHHLPFGEDQGEPSTGLARSTSQPMSPWRTSSPD